jgi:hypothetical protein
VGRSLFADDRLAGSKRPTTRSLTRASL